LTVFIKRAYPPAKLRALINVQAQKRLHREVRIGSVGVGLLQGLEISDFALSEQPSFKAGTFLSGRSISVKPSLLPLLKGNVVVNSVSLETPTFTVIRFSDGSYNFSALAGAPRKADSAPKTHPGSGGGFSLLVNRLAIRGGTIAFKDRSTADVNLTVQDLDLTVDGFSLLSPFTVKAAGRLSGRVKGKTLTADLSLKGRMSLARSGGAVLAAAKGTLFTGTIDHPNYLGHNFQVAWDLTNVGSDMNRCGGTGEISAADGKIRDLPLVSQLNALMHKNAAEIAYKRMAGHFKIVRGTLATDDFLIDGGPVTVLTKGTVSLVTLVADLRAVLKLPARSVGGALGNWTTAGDGRPTLEATIKGPLTDPTVNVETGQIAKKAGQNLLKNGLKKYLGGGSPAAGGSSSQNSPAQKALQKLFKR